MRSTDSRPLRQFQEEQLLRDEKREALFEFVTSEGWKHVAVPALEKRRAALAEQIALARSATLEQIRWYQAQFDMCDDMIRDAKAFFGEDD